jgi:hypothetical protein
MERFLAELEAQRTQYQKLNTDYVLDLAAQHFTRVRLERLREELEIDLLNNKVSEAQQRIESFRPVSLSTEDWVDVIHDHSHLVEALRQREEDTLIRYPGALGEFFGPHLERDGFVAFLAPEKRGKSFWLLDLAYRAAVRDRRRTLLFSVGDMSRYQMLRRLACRLMRRPFHAGSLFIPRALIPTPGHGGDWIVRRRLKVWQHPLKARELVQEAKQMEREGAARLKLQCTANATTTVADIAHQIEIWIRRSWVPDVVVVDYADILAPEISARRLEYRHQINETWKALRRLSQDYHLLVVTATQSDAASYEQDTIRRRHFSEDKRKLSHVTGMIGINQTEREKEQEIYRLNWVVLRDSPFLESRCVGTAGCLAIGCPAIVSTWRDNKGNAQ